MDKTDYFFLPHEKLQHLIHILQDEGYCCIGPQVQNGAIVYEELHDSSLLPWGVSHQQEPGSYRLEKIESNRAFYWANGPQAIKPLLFKSQETVWRVSRNSKGELTFEPGVVNEKPLAILGARACDLAAMGIQDKVFITSKHENASYRKRRESLFVIAINCSFSSSNCFCVSAQTGPKVSDSFDILLTELDSGFVAQGGNERGLKILSQLNLRKAREEEIKDADKESIKAAQMQTKKIPFDNQIALRDLLFANLNHPRWDEVADRCLSCGNCTSVCPTCFCHSESDTPSLDGQTSEHVREWDSCFTEGHSYLAGKPLRDTTKKRYRQWLTHKVGSWFDQFGTSGCVGCGRCVTWCPVGIDITEELAAIAQESNVRASENE